MAGQRILVPFIGVRVPTPQLREAYRTAEREVLGPIV